jgi:hypothetical protein
MTNEDRSVLLDFLADDLTADEMAALVRRLKTEPLLADELLSLAGDEARLAEWARTAPRQIDPHRTIEADEVHDRIAVDVSPVVPGIAAKRGGKSFGGLSGRVMVGTCTLAACLLIAFILQSGDDLTIDQQTDSHKQAVVDLELVARVVNESGDADWYIENRTHLDPSSVCSGDTIRLNTGSLRILFEHGTSLTLQAPAVLEVQNAMLTRMHRGSIRVLVAKGAEGFSVSTPIAKVIDLGTEFGVRVDERGGTDVVVFQGSVDVEGRLIANGPPQLNQRLSAGEAVRVDEIGTASRLVTVEPGQFPKGGGGSLEPPIDLRPPLIQEVLDNIVRAGNFNFYEIVHAGMREDALAFVDRPDHQWNGVDKAGIPPYLVGGDLVRTFNDDKLSGDLEITVRLISPATIYILLDDRVHAPDWLLRDFELVNERIGLDRGIGRLQELGPDGSPIWTQRPTGIGPGASIDETFSIWKREIPQAGDVVLGPLRGHNWDTNMYGIVAVPQEQ